MNFPVYKSPRGSGIRNSIESLPFHLSDAFVSSRNFFKVRDLDSTRKARVRGISFVRAGIQRTMAARCSAFSKETHGGLYSVYTPIEIDIPGKVGAQQNQRNNASAGIHSPSTEITDKTARDLIQLSFFFLDPLPAPWPGVTSRGINQKREPMYSILIRSAFLSSPKRGRRRTVRMIALTKE